MKNLFIAVKSKRVFVLSLAFSALLFVLKIVCENLTFAVGAWIPPELFDFQFISNGLFLVISLPFRCGLAVSLLSGTNDVKTMFSYAFSRIAARNIFLIFITTTLPDIVLSFINSVFPNYMPGVDFVTLITRIASLIISIQFTFLIIKLARNPREKLEFVLFPKHINVKKLIIVDIKLCLVLYVVIIVGAAVLAACNISVTESISNGTFIFILFFANLIISAPNIIMNDKYVVKHDDEVN